MGISAAQVKELRQATGAGMMDCKKALVECNGDLEEAKTFLKKKGIADSAKRAGRTASEGTIVAKLTEDGSRALLLEVNCETDFVARNDDFVGFATSLADFAVQSGANTIGDLLGSDWNGVAVDEQVKERSGVIGEKLVVRRLAWVGLGDKPGTIGSYIHDGKIGVLVALSAASDADAGNDALATLAKDVSMHVAATDPMVVSADEIDPAIVAKEKEIFLHQAAESGKPPEIAEKIVTGRLNKWKKEVALLNQPFVKAPDFTVEKHVAAVSKESLSGSAAVLAFARFRLGEAA